jgi:hypothetical protein
VCRSIKTLRKGREVVGEDEIRAAALQFVRKISGYRVPASHNEGVFNDAVGEITEASARLLASLKVGRTGL